MTAITLNLDSIIHLTDAQFYQLCQTNQDVKFERTAKGELIVMPPAGGESSKRNADLTTEVNIWNRQTNLGVVFDSSGGFKLPNGADRSPDAAWVKLERWEALTREQRQKFPPLAPDFVVELRSASDDLKPLQEKMQEYRDNGVRLGWLIDPQNQRVEIYRPGREEVNAACSFASGCFQPDCLQALPSHGSEHCVDFVEVLQSPASLSGEDVLPRFVLNLSGII